MSKTLSSLLCLVLIASVFLIEASLADHDEQKHKHRRQNHHKAEYYELNHGNMSVKFTNWGATIVSFRVPDQTGTVDDIVLGYDTIDEYKNDTVYFGALVGRVANRIGRAKFKLDGETYIVSANDGKNMLHGGKKGFSDVIWRVKHYKPYGHAPSISFFYKSHDGEEGFPGDLLVKVTYTLHGDQKFTVKMKAIAKNKATPVNLAQHTYWNLGGYKNGDVLSHELQLFGSSITTTNDELIPTGKIVSVKGTPYDFLKPRTIGGKLKKLPEGYDINYVLDGKRKGMKKVAVVYDSKTGRKMELSCDKPGVQFYAGGQLKNVKGKRGAVYGAHYGLALETQGFPDSVNHPNFPSVIVNPGEEYEHTMLFKFSTTKRRLSDHGVY